MPETGEQKRQRVARNLAKLKAANRPPEEIARYLETERETAVPEQSALEQIGAGAETALDAATLGGSGLVADLVGAAGDESFADMRKARAERKALFRKSHPILGTGLEVAGALATPLPGAGVAKLGETGLSLGGALIRQAPQTAGWLARTAGAAGDAALQSGVAGTVGNLNDLSAEGVKQALGAGAGSAALGGIIGGGLGSAAEMGTRAVGRIRNMGRLDKAAFALKDDLAKLDEENFGQAIQEARATGTTPPIHDVLESQTIKPYADMIRRSETHAGKSDAEVLIEARKLMSQAEREATKSIEGTAEHRAKQALARSDIGLAKERMLQAAESPSRVVTMGRAVDVPPPADGVKDFSATLRDVLGQDDISPVTAAGLRDAFDRARAPSREVIRPSQTIELGAGIPSLRKAVDVHRTKMGEREALQRGADVGLSVGRAKSVKGDKLTIEGREAFLRSIPKMTQPEAQLALAGILGRFPEQLSLTSSPLGLFGLVTSAARAPLTAYRTMPIIRALEAKIGRGEVGQNTGNVVRGTLSRLIGAQP